MKSLDSFYLFPLCLGKDKHNEDKEKASYFVSPRKSQTMNCIYNKTSPTNEIITTQSENIYNNSTNISNNISNSKSLTNLHNYFKHKDESVLTTAKCNLKMLCKSSSTNDKFLKSYDDIIYKSHSPTRISNHYRLPTYKSINNFISDDCNTIHLFSTHITIFCAMLLLP